MKIQMLAGAACAALMGLALPANAATTPEFAVMQAQQGSADQAVSAFYASRRNTPLWLRSGVATPAAQALIGALSHARLDGLASGPALAAQAQVLLNRAAAGDPVAQVNAERLLSTAWVLYVQALETPPAGVSYGDNWVAPRRSTASAILARAAAAPSLDEHVRTVSSVNPLYAQLRDAAWAQMQANGGEIDARVLANLGRARTFPVSDRYVMVDAASARLYMIEGGRITDSMKVIVGKASTQTPMMASTIHYATLNPYWNVPGDLIQKLIAPRVVDQGVAYLKSHNYEVLSPTTGEAIDPATVDWNAIKAGQQTVRLRQLPGPGNSMGQVKFAFANAYDIYLHDTPSKDLFAQSDRDLSNGCIRLEDASRLGRWLLGREPQVATTAPEQHVALPKPVPIYVTYLTAQAPNGQLTFLDDVYGRDGQQGAQVAALR